MIWGGKMKNTPPFYTKTGEYNQYNEGVNMKLKDGDG